jgi:HK97 family phage prohead protease
MDVNRLCTRAVDFTPLTDEERSDDSDGRTMEGYGAVFGVDTEINSWEGKFKERIAKGAFKKTISERKPVLQFDHGHDARTGSVPIGKIEELSEDKSGLKVKARLFDNPVVEPIRQAIEGEAISGMSFRFKVVRDQWTDKDGKTIKRDELHQLLWDPGERGPLSRTIREVDLFEVGPVVFPAYSQTSVGVRSLTDAERDSLVNEYARTAELDDEPDGPEVVSEEVEEQREDETSPPTPPVVEGTSGHNKSVRERRLTLLDKE